MSDNTSRINLWDVANLLHDPELPIHSTDGIRRINTSLTRYFHEFQSLKKDVALEYIVNLCREIDADFDGMRTMLTHKLHVLDVIQDLRSAGDMEQASMLAAMMLQLDRVEEKIDVAANSAAATAKAASKKIDPNGYYSYTEAVEIVGVSESTLRRQVKQNNLRTVKIGGRVKFVGNDLLIFQQERDRGIRILGE